MPELPEVETFARSLRPFVVGQQIAHAWSSGQGLRASLDARALRALQGVRIKALDRMGKYLLFRLSNGKVLVGHLGMSGCFLLAAGSAALPPHTHLRLSFAGTDLEMRYVDPRRFGSMRVLAEAQLEACLGLGPDPLGPAFTVEALHAALHASRRDLKSLLMDQRVVAGLGNIYAAEALFVAGLRPTRRGITLGRRRTERLHGAIRAVLEQAVSHRGTTLSDHGYLDALGRPGDHQHHLYVYGRQGLPCLRCGAPIRRSVQAQRSTFYCPQCQQ
ncbi:MAG: bifunctional DNA-formamidopyrimidine glycosylase/DNA-(apurinic or apyrimidinic site) lyase [Myxococcales bacterium]|nr:bifunctional DNA-formamidopyrimidine glycosylase/DNA-(apurinic or apyrimidinic site) lyase [Myxococcota bacterium]MDW8280651.1 bifunctional DNA-formamidopyrimidine glycosylase/DNA-(apurinic or apyrimidinic site) lyase [Myxococcales bacterium]